MRKLLAIILAAAMFASTAAATDIGESVNDTIQLETSEGTTADITTDEYDSLVSISEDEAKEIALLFVQDAVSFEDVAWNSDTYVTKVVPMYDETSEKNIVAYTVELDSGYVVVSAYADAKSLIPEWSDCEAPVYTSLNPNDENQILYLGAYGYYLDNGDSVVTDLDGNSVEKAELTNEVELGRDVSNIPVEVIDNYIESSDVEPGIATTAVIEDPFKHANANYTGPFVCNDYVNRWEKYATFYTTTDFSKVNGTKYYNHCGPTAITNLICMYQHKYNGKKYNLDDAKTVFDYVAKYGIKKGHYHNSSSLGGTVDTSAGAYIRNVFSNYLGVKAVTLLYEVKYTNFKSSLSNGRLMYIMLLGHSTYGNHHIVGYAYTRLRSTTTGWYKTYLKVCDGWGERRYIDLATVSSSSSYYEVSFG